MFIHFDKSKLSRCTKIDVRSTSRNDLIINVLKKLKLAFIYASLLIIKSNKARFKKNDGLKICFFEKKIDI
jgi:hypothetical protein